MECSKCGAKWDVSKEMESKLVKCPFCGEGLKKAPAEKIIIKDVSSCVRYISNVYSADIFESKLKLISLVSDFLPSHDDDIRLLKTALDSGIVSRFKGLDESKIENERQNAILILTEKYFIGREHAERVTDWIISGFFSDYTTPKAEPESVSSASSTASAEPSVSQQGGAASSAQKKSANASASPAVSTAPPPPPATGSVKGKFTFPEGIYDGEVVDGKREGYGTITYPDGTIYKGFWHKDKRNGKGTEYKSKGKKIYRGDFKNGDRHGEGTLYHYDGKTAKYEGSWLYGSRSGQGTEYNEDGSIYYQGEWSVDSKDGHGTLYKSNNTRIEGTWQHGFFSKGTYFYLDGHRYEGELSSFGYDREGKGVYYWPDGYRYEGEWHDGERHGQGIMYHKNGKKMYEGEWQDGKYHGQGTLYSKLGFKLYSGQWINGEKAK